MEQHRALNALEPFLALAPSASSPRAAADLVTAATSAPHTCVFAELLARPHVAALAESPEYASYLTLLEIFAWGTLADYEDPANLAYDVLLRELHLASPRELESLVTTAIYQGLITAHLDPLHQRVAVSAIAPLRDLAPNSVPRLLASLGDWDARCSAALAGLEAEISQISAAARERADKQAKHERLLEDALKRADDDVKGEGKKPVGIGGGGASSGPSAASTAPGKKSAAVRWSAMIGGRGGAGNSTGGGRRADAMDVDDDEGGAGAGASASAASDAPSASRGAKRKGRG